MKPETTELGQRILETTRRAFRRAVEQIRLPNQHVAVSADRDPEKILNASVANI